MKFVIASPKTRAGTYWRRSGSLEDCRKLEEYLQSAISFLQTQEAVLERILSILEEIAKLEPLVKADVIRNITKAGRTIKENF